MGNRVPRVKTEISEAQMAQAISEAWSDLFKNTPTKEQISLILAQNALETGHRKAMWNFNVGNLTTNGTGRYDYFDDLSTKEQVQPGIWKKMNLKYRAYPTLKEGVVDYLKLLSNPKGRYYNAWKNIVNPDPAAFSKALKAGGYYTSNEEDYTKNINALYKKFNSSKLQDGEKTKYIAQTNTNNILDKYIQMISKANNDKQLSLKKYYKNNLSNNDILIKINSDDYITSIEFGRVLCMALEEELVAEAYTHTDGKLVEIECNISGPSSDCFKAVQQLTNAIASTFQDINKIGNIFIDTQCLINKKSKYYPISYKLAEANYRAFQLKLI